MNPITDAIDVALMDIQHQSLVDADKVRDLLLDLRTLAAALGSDEA